MSSSTSQSQVMFNGNPSDLDQFLTIIRLEIQADTDDDMHDGHRAARLASRLTGPALDWFIASSLIQPNLNSSYDVLSQSLRDNFGLSSAQYQAGVRLQLANVRQGSMDLLEFLSLLSTLATVSGLGQDPTLLAIAPGKLAPKYQTAIAMSGTIFSSWDRMRTFLINVYAQDPPSAPQLMEPRSKTRKPKCGKCGKRGHTTDVCRTKN